MSQGMFVSGPPESPPPEYKKAVSIITRYQQGQQLSLRDLAYVARHYPEAAQEISQQERARRIISRWEGGERLTTRETAFLARHYPEAAEQIGRSVRAKGIVGQWQQTGQIGTRKLGFLARYFPEAAQAIGRHEKAGGILGSWVSEGFPTLSLRETGFLARYYPETLTSMQSFVADYEHSLRQQEMSTLRTQQTIGQLVFLQGQQHWDIHGADIEAWDIFFAERRARRQVKGQMRIEQTLGRLEEQRIFQETGEPPKYVMAIREFEKAKYQQRISTEFYTGLGYPEYAGKYLPFEIPENYLVATIKEKEKGLEIIFEPTKKPRKGLAETIASMEELPSLDISPTPWYMQPITRPKEQHPERYFAGLIAGVEAPVYTIGRLAGFETPEPPPTVTGGLIGKGLSVTPWFGPSTELERALEYGPEYAVGTIMGDVLVSMAVGKGIEKTVTLTVKGAKKVAPIIKTGLQQVATTTKTRLLEPTLRFALGPERYYYYKFFGRPDWLGKPEWYLTTKAFGKVAMGQARYAKDILLQPIHLPKPEWYLTTKAFGKVVMGQARYAVDVLRQPITVSFGKPEWYLTSKAFGKVVMGQARYAKDIMLQPVHLPTVTKPLWLLEIKAFGKVVMGQARYAKDVLLQPLHIPSLGISTPRLLAETKMLLRMRMGKFRYMYGLPAPSKGYSTMGQIYFAEDIFKTVKVTELSTTGKTMQLIAPTVTKTTKSITTATTTIGAATTAALKTLTPTKQEEKKTTAVPSLVKWSGEAYPFGATMPWGKTGLQQYPKREVKMPTYPEITLPQVEKIITPSKAEIDITPKIDITPRIDITPKIEPFLATDPFQGVRVKQAQFQKQIQSQLQKQRMSYPQFEWPRPKRKKKRDYGEEWFKRTHAILTPKELEKKLSFKFTMPRQKRKKKRKSWEPTIPKIRF